MIQVNQNPNFNDIRKVLLSPSEEMANIRKSLSICCSFSKGIAGVVEIASGASTVIALIATFQVSLLGSFFALSSFFTALGAHETRVIAKNGEDLVDSTILFRGQAAISPHQFTQILLKDTLITQHFFGSLIMKALTYNFIFSRCEN